MGEGITPPLMTQEELSHFVRGVRSLLLSGARVTSIRIASNSGLAEIRAAVRERCVVQTPSIYGPFEIEGVVIQREAVGGN